ncbi:MAG: 8-oxoguanine deaminase [Betaproteobacteria bacterium]|nr:8-oxoguanine deaminase [Betaproteobacteria bacterium]
MSQTVLLQNCLVLATMDDARREITGGAVYIRGNVIEQVGPGAALPRSADRVIDLAGHVVMPGLVNTHHHMFQSLTRAVPAAQDCELFDWLKVHYPLWCGITPEMIHVSALTAMAELMLSGCTTASDHLYMYPNGSRIDDEIGAAREIGIRFHPGRGGMSMGESQGGLPPDRLTEPEPAILRAMQRAIETFHDPARHSMLRIAVAPCSPFSVTPDLMRESARLARSFGVHMHTHLAENWKDLAFSRERFGMDPVDYAEDLGWLGHDVWHAHCVHLDERGIGVFAGTGTGVAHCPTSNMRLGSGIAPVRRMRDAGMRVGLGVDGSASNDGGHLLGEARQCLLLQRAAHGPAALSARAALEIATRGGAAVLGRDDIGQIAPGFAADIVAFDLEDIGYAGQHDPLAALLLCAPARAAWSMINGRVVVEDGTLVTVDINALARRHRALATTLLRG